MVECSLGVLSLFSFVYSWSVMQVKTDSCDDICSYQTYIKKANCTNRGLTEIPSACQEAYTLNISSNNLHTLPRMSFNGYSHLHYLYLQNNQISSISPGVLDDVRHTLVRVYITNNHVQEIQANTFVNMTLRYLYLSHNQISRIDPEAFNGMTSLLKLYLGNNRLTSLEYAIFNHMPNLLQINLRNNMIASIDVSFISSLASCQKIFLQNNSIVDLMGHVQMEQTSLVLINLSQNQLRSFDCSVTSNLFGLNDLYLADNSLQTIEGCNPQQMSTLKVGDNPFYCNCSLRLLFTWLQMTPDAPSPNCWSPESLRETPIRDAPLESCQEDEVSSTASTAHPRTQTHSTTLKESTKHLQTSFYQKVNENHIKSTVGFIPGTETLLIQMTMKGDSSVAENSITHIFSRVENSVFEGPFGISLDLFIIVIVIVILFFVIIILLISCVKCYCSQTGKEDEKKRYYDTSHESLEDAVDATMHLTCNHNYESINENHLRTTNRQQSFDSQRSSATMLPGQMSHSTECYSRSSGVWNYSLGSHHICTCECHEDMSEESGSFEECHGSSCSDVSYEMDNHINEVSESRPSLGNCCEIEHRGRVNHSRTLDDRNGCRHSHERNVHISFTSSLGGRYPHSTFVSHPFAPPLPPKKAGDEMYIQHSQLQSQRATNIMA